MRKILPIIAAALLTTASAFAQDVAGEGTMRLGNVQDAGAARLLWPTRAHPEVAVSRSLAAQPVHPYLAKVQIGSMTTWIDPADRLDGARGMLENNRLAKAVRMHRSLGGITTEQLAALRNASLAAQPRAAGVNQARVILPPQAGPYKTIDQVDIRPVLILPAPNAAPQPRSAPAPADQKLLAAGTD